MYGDFARVTFDALNNRSRVLMQQGRVQLEADWNEQGAIFLYLLRTLAKDLIGPAGGPAGNCGFAVLTRKWVKDSQLSPAQKKQWLEMLSSTSHDFLIGTGHYYVDGILCENPNVTTYLEQPFHFGAGPLKLDDNDKTAYLVYLDVAEYSVFAAQDDSMLEVAIGIETAIRARQSWVVRTVPVTVEEKSTKEAAQALEDINPSWVTLVDQWQPANRGRLKVRAGRGSDDPSSGPCIVAPQSRYRGAENQLYRVEVHRGGTLTPGKKGGTKDVEDRPSFKFSRVNGSAVYRIESFEEPVVTLADLGRDDRFDLDVGNCVEILDDTTILPDEPGPLRKVTSIDTFTRRVTLEPLAGTGESAELGKNPYMRRWDQRQGDPGGRGLKLEDGVAPIELPNNPEDWIPLEDGVEIQFQAQDPTKPVVFRAGDYWLAPARVATGGIIDWPLSDDEKKEPLALPPQGVEHHYAPLAILAFDGAELSLYRQYRKVFGVGFSAGAMKVFGPEEPGP